MTTTSPIENLTDTSAAEMVERLTVSKRELRRLVSEAVSLRGQVEHLGHALADGENAEGKDLVVLYAVAGKVLPEIVEKTFDQVKAFHLSVTAFR